MSSAYEKFITANHALFACYEAVSNDVFQAMPKHDQDAVCATEKTAVSAMLKED
jgi:TRAP-type C4-dicarboxylate transport system substrate-binding protein